MAKTPPINLSFIQEGVIATAVPPEILVRIFLHLDITSLMHVRKTCQLWNIVGNFQSLWVNISQEMLLYMLEVIDDLITRVASLKRHLSNKSRERLDFLFGTLKLLQEFTQLQIKEQYWTHMPDTSLTTRLIVHTVTQLMETSDMLTHLETRQMKMTVNFDIYELILRRYYEEVKTMLPLQHPSVPSTEDSRSTILDPAGTDDPSAVVSTPMDVCEDPVVLDESVMCCDQEVDDPRLSVITNPEDLAFWRQHVGNACHCSFDHFCQILSSNFKTPRYFQSYFSYLFDFTEDKLMTTYRYQSFVNMFGPIQFAIECFRTYVLGNGFVGLVNMVKSEEIMRELRPKVNTVLIRFSRQKTLLLAFTAYDSQTRTIEHRRNVDPNGKVIPIATFLKEQYPGYLLAEVRIPDMATKMNSTFNYASSADPYLMHT